MHETVESSVNKRKASLQTKAASEWQGEMRAQLGTHTHKQYTVILSTSCSLGELILTSNLVNVDSALKFFFIYIVIQILTFIKECWLVSTFVTFVHKKTARSYGKSYIFYMVANLYDLTRRNAYDFW